MKTLEKLCLKLMALVGTILFVFLLIYSWRYTMRLFYSEAICDERDNLLINMLFLVTVAAVVVLVSKLAQALSEKTVHIIAVICAILVAMSGCVLARCADIFAVADQAEIYVLAEAISRGNAKWLADYEYFKVYPFQIGVAEIYAALFKMAGTVSYLVIEYAQSIATGITVYAGFRITRELFRDKRAELIYLVCAMGFLPLYIYCIYIYGEAFGVSLAMLSIWFFIRANRDTNTRKESVLYFMLSALFFGVACVARRALLVVWIAMAIIQILICMRRKRMLPLFGVMLLLLSMNLWGTAFLHFAEKQMGKEIGEACPAILWVAMGLMDAADGDMRGPGNYNGFNRVTYVESNYDRKVASAVAKGYIADRIKEWGNEPLELVHFFKEKILVQWNEPTYGAFAMTAYMENPEKWVEKLYMDEEISAGVRGYLNSYQAIAYLALLGYFLLILRGKLDARQSLLGVILLGGFFMSALWETKSRYIYPYMVFVLPSVAESMVLYVTGWKELSKKCRRCVKERLQNK